MKIIDSFNSLSNTYKILGMLLLSLIIFILKKPGMTPFLGMIVYNIIAAVFAALIEFLLSIFNKRKINYQYFVNTWFVVLVIIIFALFFSKN